MARVALGGALLALAAAPGASAGSRPSQSVEECAAGKLVAAARECRAVLNAWAKRDRGRHSFDQLRARKIALAEKRLAARWMKIDAVPLESGAQCDEATGTADDVSAVVTSHAQALAEAFPSASPVPRGRSRSATRLAAWLRGIRSQQQLRAAAELCSALLDAEAVHLLDRFDDRLRAQLGADRAAAVARFEGRWDLLDWIFGSGDGPDRDAVLRRLQHLVARVVGTVAVSPQVSPSWEMVQPPAVVDYQGRELRPTCWDGAPWMFFVRRGSVNKLIVNYQGGGACWSAATCGGIPALGVSPTFKQSVGPGDNPANFQSGFADDSNPDNPFRDWHAIFVPYCTGDVHWGDAVVDYELLGQVTTVRHKGFVNAQVAEKWAREHFVHPEQVFVTGSSAGAYGAIVNSLYLQEKAYPSADFAVLGDAGNGVITQDFLANDLANWGIEANLPPWIPGLNLPLTELRASDLYIEAAATYPQNRFATYTAAYDSGQGGQTGFFQVMRVGSNILDWVRWWDSSCLWNQEMRALNAEAAAGAGNFRFYVGTGSAHTMWGRDKVYDDTTGNVPTVRDWIVSMLLGDAGWINVEAEDFGVLLPGDPRPDPTNPLHFPPFEPFDLQAGRIDCGPG